MVDRKAVKARLQTLLEEACKREYMTVLRLSVKFGGRYHEWYDKTGEGRWLNGAPNESLVLSNKKMPWGRLVTAWRRYSSGYAYWGERSITVVTGHDEFDQHCVLLHELAHVIEFDKRRNRKHDQRFWRTAKRLYEKAGLDVVRALERDAKVYKRAAKHI